MKQQVAIYLRLSLEDVDKRTNAVKDESNSISAQRLLIHRHLDQNPQLCDLPRVEFCDDGFTGTKFDRPDFTRMIDMVRHGEISCIVVKDLSRFGRDYLEVGDYLEHIFPFLGVRFKSINDHYDSQNHTGKTIGMDVAFRNLIYDYYSKDLSKKVKTAMRMKQKECSYVSCAPYGYRVLPDAKHQLVIDPETAPIVRRIFTDIIAGKTCPQIARELNNEGIPSPLAYKKVTRSSIQKELMWTHKSIHTIIDNIKYTGTMVNHTRESRYIRDENQRKVPKEEWYMRENAHEAIVSGEEFEAAQKAIHSRKQTVRQKRDMTDRVYYCGHCGGKLAKENGKFFACPSHRARDNSPCKIVHLEKSEIESTLFEALKAQVVIVSVKAAERKSTLVKRRNEAATRIASVQTQLNAFGRDKVRMYEDYREGRITREDYLTRKSALLEEEATLNTRLSELEEEIKANAKEAKIITEQQNGIKRYVGLTDEALKEHLYDAVEKIVVYSPDNIEIVWKFNDSKSGTGMC